MPNFIKSIQLPITTLKENYIVQLHSPSYHVWKRFFLVEWFFFIWEYLGQLRWFFFVKLELLLFLWLFSVSIYLLFLLEKFANYCQLWKSKIYSLFNSYFIAYNFSAVNKNRVLRDPKLQPYSLKTIFSNTSRMLIPDHSNSIIDND